MTLNDFRGGLHIGNNYYRILQWYTVLATVIERTASVNLFCRTATREINQRAPSRVWTTRGLGRVHTRNTNISFA